MSASSEYNPKLSLVAEYDDMCRFANSLITIDETAFIQMVQNFEEYRVKWYDSERQTFLLREKVKRLEDENSLLDSQLKKIRFAFGKEVQNREEMVKQNKKLRDHLNSIKEFVLEEPVNNESQETRHKVLSYLNLNRLETVNEELASPESSNLIYDVTEDDILEGSVNPLNKSKRKSSSKGIDIQQKVSKTVSQDMGSAFDLNTNEMQVEREVFKTNTETERITISEMRTPVVSNANRMRENMTPDMRFKPISQSSPYIRNNPQLFKRGSQESLFGRTNLLDDRKHNFHQKKAFKPVQCGPCGKAIGFCGNFLCCSECGGICHNGCRDQLSLPCIPFRKPNGKGSRMVLIADFAPQTRPMIPALIIHCCNEIDKRGLDEEGLYRKSGSDKDVRELKSKILKTKSGMPVLRHYDVHVLCGVVKLFLRELDEPIVTRVLWRDFVRASDQDNSEAEQRLIMQTVGELPTANRDSLSFIILHLQRVSQSPNTLMDILSLAKVFGPTIVGYSMIDPPMSELLAENPKQIKVMEALLKIPEDFWTNIISTNNYSDRSPHSSPDRRRSLGTRLFGNFETGTLTPHRSNAPSKGSLTLKPLF